MNESDEAIARDVAAINRISAVPAMLRVICKHTGLGFAAIARVTDDSWTACAVEDNINFGIKPGGKLDISTTLCLESRAARRPVVIDHATNDPIYRDHPTPRIYHIESYISVPIILPSGEYFGNLCAVDPRPAVVSDTRTVSMFTLFAELIALQLESEGQQTRCHHERNSERETSELREQYVALLGHDLREPITEIRASGETLAQHPSDPGVVTIGHHLKAIAQRMSRRVDDIIDFTRGRLGAGIGVRKTPVSDLDIALRDVVDELRAFHPGREIETTISVNTTVVCDRVRVRQLLSNLLGNALAHGAQDRRVTVEITVERGMLVLKVCNAGNPISQTVLTRIFDPHRRPASATDSGGLGLGLYLCAQIINAHAGSLQVSSSPDEGTCFVAMLPIGR